MSVQLKIKQKHLALEPQIIRFEEQKLKERIKHAKDEKDARLLGYTLYSLENHRKWNVRNESRATGLARAYLKGKPYAAVEPKRKDERLFKTTIVPRILDMVQKYGGKKVTAETILEWAKQS